MFKKICNFISIIVGSIGSIFLIMSLLKKKEIPDIDKPKEESLKKQKDEIEKDIENIDKKLNKLKEDKVEDKTLEEEADYWNNELN